MITSKILQSENEQTDVLRVCFCIALMLHMMVILGITFKVIPIKSWRMSNKVLEVTLAQHQSLIRPEKADYLAQANQAGSGESVERRTPAEPEPPIFWSNESHDNDTPSTSAPDRAIPVETTILTSQQNQHAQVPAITPEDSHEDQAATGTGEVDNSAQTMASLLAKIEEQRLAIATRPRRRTISAAAHEARDALYLEAWRKRVERIGNLNYPAQAKARHIHGDLRLLVAINANGTVRDVEIRESSGSAVLDDAAVRIVRLAAPFPEFPANIRKDTDVLEIIRTWEFRPDYQLLARN